MGDYYVWVTSIYPGETGDYAIQLSGGSEAVSLDKLLAQGRSPALSLKQSRKAMRSRDSWLKGGTPFANPHKCVGSTVPFAASVEICIGSQPGGQPFNGSVMLSGPSGVVFSTSDIPFSVC